MSRVAALALLVALMSLSLGESTNAVRAQRRSLRQPGTATAMAGLEGEACDEDEHKRYKTIVCKVEETCGCSGTVCELDWCSKYVHEWKKEFGACLLKGCGEPEAK